MKTSKQSTLRSILVLLILFTLSVSVIGKEYSFSELRSRPYVGGSLKFDSSNPSISQLKAGCFYPIQLQKLSKTYLGYIDGIHEYEYDEIPTQTKYGTIKVVDVSTSRITISCQLYDYSGTPLYPVSYRLDLGNKIDINNDGKYDLTYVSNVNSTRSTRSSVRFLQFLSPSEETHCAMYSYTPDYDFDLNNAGGVLGYNVDGCALVDPEMMNSAVRTRSGDYEYTRSESPDLSVGDFIYNEDLGQYCRVRAVINLRDGRSSFQKECSGISLHEVLKVASLKSADFLSQETIDSLSKNTRSLEEVSPEEYHRRMNKYRKLVKGLNYNFELPISNVKEININGKKLAEAGLLKCDVLLGVGIQASIGRKNTYLRTQRGMLIDSKIGAKFYGQNVNEDIPIFNRNRTKRIPFRIGIFPCYVDLGAGVGINANIQYNGYAETTEIGHCFAGFNFKDTEISLKRKKGIQKKVHSHIKDFCGYRDFNLAEKFSYASMSITPSLSLSSSVGIGGRILGADMGLKTTLGLTAKADVTPTPSLISFSASLTRNFDIDLIGHIKLLFWEKNGSWNLYNDSKILWNKSWSVATKPNIEFLANTENGYNLTAINQKVEFVSSNTGGGGNYVWEFGDGTTSTSINPNKVYTRPGEFNVKLTVRNSSGSDYSQRKINVISPLPSSMLEAYMNAD